MGFGPTSSQRAARETRWDNVAAVSGPPHHRIVVIGRDVGDPSDPAPTVRAHRLADTLPNARVIAEQTFLAEPPDAEVVIAPPWADLAALGGLGLRLIVDLAHARPFAPHLAEKRLGAAVATDRLTDALRCADHLITSTESQRDLWIGAMVSERLLRYEGYTDDPTLRSLIEVVPTPSSKVAGELTAVDSRMILWNGPRHSWLDWATAEAAVAQIPGVSLVTMDSDRWLTEQERATLVSSAACVIHLHRGDLALRYTASERLSDCISWGTPMVATRGDDTARHVAALGLGEVVPAGDTGSVAAAITRVIDARARYTAAFTRARAQWVGGAATVERMIQRRPQSRPLATRLARRTTERIRRLGRRLG